MFRALNGFGLDFLLLFILLWTVSAWTFFLDEVQPKFNLNAVAVWHEHIFTVNMLQY